MGYYHDEVEIYANKLLVLSYEAERVASWTVVNKAAFDDDMDELLNNLDNAINAVTHIMATIIIKASSDVE